MVQVLMLQACFPGGNGVADVDDSAVGRAQVQIGIPNDQLGFIPLEEGGDVPLATFGQGGTHAELAVRCIGLGNEAFVDVTLENLETGETVMTPPASRPPLLLCREGGCDLVPLYVMTGGLADPEQKDGLRVRITAEARNVDGVSAEASIEAVLRRTN